MKVFSLENFPLYSTRPHVGALIIIMTWYRSARVIYIHMYNTDVASTFKPSRVLYLDTPAMSC